MATDSKKRPGPSSSRRDTLFNKCDYDDDEKLWSPHYIRHSAHIAPGREGLLV